MTATRTTARHATALVSLLAISAFSAFPSPFYAHIADASGWGLWASAVLFSSHGVAVIVAMSAVRMVTRWVGTDALVPAALFVDAGGGLLLMTGMAGDSLSLLLSGRVVTGVALGLATPVLSEVLSHRERGVAVVTAGTLGGVGLGALGAGLLHETGIATGAVFGLGTLLLLAVALGAVAVPTGSGRPLPRAASAPGHGRGSAGPIAVVVVFVANGVLGLFTSLVPAVVVERIGGGALLAGILVAGTMLGAGAARLVLSVARMERVAAASAATLAAGTIALAAGASYGEPEVVLIGCVLMGAACGLGYDAGLRMAIGSKVDALVRLRSLAQVQRAGQLGLVIPALIFPALRHL